MMEVILICCKFFTKKRDTMILMRKLYLNLTSLIGFIFYFYTYLPAIEIKIRITRKFIVHSQFAFQSSRTILIFNGGIICLPTCKTKKKSYFSNGKCRYHISCLPSYLITLQKKEAYDWWNVPAKRFKICHILYIYIRKPKVTFLFFVSYYFIYPPMNAHLG